MVVRRDILGHAPPTATITKITAAAEKTPEEIPAAPVPHPPLAAIHLKYTMSPLQQREAMKREQWDKERKNLLRKASNFGGESAERIIGDYLAI